MLLDVNILIAEKTNAPPEASAWSKIAALSTKVESLLGELQTLWKDNASIAGMNPIVSRVLEHASISIGFTETEKNDVTSNNEDEDVGDMLIDE